MRDLEKGKIDDNHPDRIVKIGAQLPPQIRDDLTNFLRENTEVFAWSYEDMLGMDPEIISNRLSIDPAFKPIRQKRRAYDVEWYIAMKEEVDKLTKIGFIHEFNYPSWLANVVMLVDSTADHELLSFMDAHSGYNQILIVMVDHRIQDVVETFEVSSGKFIGFMVSQCGIEANPQKIKALLNMTSLRTLKEVQSLTGHVAALNRFISRATDRCQPFFQAIKGRMKSLIGPLSVSMLFKS
ncbi:unnamed protein product [Prunus brigantina]